MIFLWSVTCSSTTGDDRLQAKAMFTLFNIVLKCQKSLTHSMKGFVQQRMASL